MGHTRSRAWDVQGLTPAEVAQSFEPSIFRLRSCRMPYALVVLAVLVFIFGVTQLKSVQSHRTPWGALLVWAILFFGGAAVWMAAARIH